MVTTEKVLSESRNGPVVSRPATPEELAAVTPQAFTPSIDALATLRAKYKIEVKELRAQIKARGKGARFGGAIAALEVAVLNTVNSFTLAEGQKLYSLSIRYTVNSDGIGTFKTRLNIRRPRSKKVVTPRNQVVKSTKKLRK